MKLFTRGNDKVGRALVFNLPVFQTCPGSTLWLALLRRIRVETDSPPITLNAGVLTTCKEAGRRSADMVLDLPHRRSPGVSQIGCPFLITVPSARSSTVSPLRS